jgi:hypothetical protein
LSFLVLGPALKLAVDARAFPQSMTVMVRTPLGRETPDDTYPIAPGVEAT